MAKTINDVIDDILRREGGFADRAADKGGPTNLGITARSWGDYRHLGRVATADELKAITTQEAKAFYWDVFVSPLSGLAEPLRSLVVDWSVTSGPREPMKAVQTALRAFDLYRGPVDGIYGPETSAALVHVDVKTVYNAVLRARVQFYQRIALLGDKDTRDFLDTHPKCQLLNLAGWTNRCLEFLT